MMRVLQFIFGVCTGWGFLFAGLMQMSDSPWYQTAILITVGLVLFGIGLRPIFGKGTVRGIVLWSALGLAGFFLKYFASSTIVGNRTIGLIALLLLAFGIYKLAKFIISKVKLHRIKSNHYQDI